MKFITPIIAILLCASCEERSFKFNVDKGVSKRMSDEAHEFIDARFQKSGDFLYCNYAGNVFYQIKDINFDVSISTLSPEEGDKFDEKNQIVEHVEIRLKLDYRKNPVGRRRIASMVPYPIAVDDTEWGEWSDWMPFNGFTDGESYDTYSWLRFEGKATKEDIKFRSVWPQFGIITEELELFMSSDSQE